MQKSQIETRFCKTVNRFLLYKKPFSKMSNVDSIKKRKKQNFYSIFNMYMINTQNEEPSYSVMKYI